MTCCPTCGQAIAGPAPVQALADAKLSAMERRIVDALARAFPRGIHSTWLVELVYADDPNGGPEWAAGVVKVVIFRLRRKLRPLGWSIPNRRPGKGNIAIYRLERVQ